MTDISTDPLAAYADFPAPLYLADPGAFPSFQPNRGPGEAPAFILSIPKSGTYLLGALLSELGLVSTGVHHWEEGFHDYRNRTIREMIERYQEFAVVAPFETTSKLIAPGQFSVGHLKYMQLNRYLLKRFRTFFCHRELRACLISYMRWSVNPGRAEEGNTDWKKEPDGPIRMAAFLKHYGHSYLDWVRRISGWMRDAAPLQVSFEIFNGDYGAMAQIGLVRLVAQHVGVPLTEAGAEALLAKIIGASTKTWSGKRSSLDDYWSGTCEALFLEMRGDESNLRLGYSGKI